MHIPSRPVTLPFAAGALLLAACAKSASEAASTASPPAASAATPAPTMDTKPIAAALVKAGMIKTGDKVLISGSVRDAGLMEDIAVETMKAGGQPMLTIGSDQLTRRSFTDVPASYDKLSPSLDMAINTLFDANISIDVGESDSVMAGIPPERIAARAQAELPAGQTLLKRGVRSVSLGNGLYPTATLAARLGKPQAEVADIFWKAVNVSPDSIRAAGEAMRAALSGAKQVTLTSPNGTDITFAVNGAKGSVSDGALTPEKLKLGGYAAQTWLPAGELLLAVTPGTADGKIVVDKAIARGMPVTGLTLTVSKGKVTGMTATSGLDAFKAGYDAAGSGKDLFSYIDLGLNRAVTLPTNTGRIVWMAAGGVTIGVGDNTGWGGTNVSDFAFAGAVPGATLKADGKTLIDNGKLP